MPYVKTEHYRNGSGDDGGLGKGLKSIVGMVKDTVKNSASYAVTLIEQGKYEDAKIFLKNALEGIEILEG